MDSTKINWDLYNLIPQGIFVVDSQCQIVYWNSLIANWSKINPENAIGKNLFSLFPRLDNFKYKGRIEETLSSGTPSHFSSLIHKYLIPCPLTLEEGFAFHETTVTRLESNNSSTSNYGIFTVIDVTESHVRIMKQKRLSKLKDEFLAVCSHDLKAPLNSILGFTEVLLEEELIKENFETEVKQIEKSGFLLLDIINSLLTLSEVTAPKSQKPKEVFYLSEVVNNSISNLKGLSQKKNIFINLNIETSQEAKILGRPLDLQRAINNLFSNAIKFTPEKGEITFTITQDENSLYLHIKDTGVGIAPNKIPMLFKAFSGGSTTGTAGEKGTGLGLSIVKAIIDQHLGQVQVTSQVGKGTLIQIKFPIHV